MTPQQSSGLSNVWVVETVVATSPPPTEPPPMFAMVCEPVTDTVGRPVDWELVPLRVMEQQRSADRVAEFVTSFETWRASWSQRSTLGTDREVAELVSFAASYDLGAGLGVLTDRPAVIAGDDLETFDAAVAETQFYASTTSKRGWVILDEENTVRSFFTGDDIEDDMVSVYDDDDWSVFVDPELGLVAVEVEQPHLEVSAWTLSENGVALTHQHGTSELTGRAATAVALLAPSSASVKVSNEPLETVFAALFDKLFDAVTAAVTNDTHLIIRDK